MKWVLGTYYYVYIVKAIFAIYLRKDKKKSN
jgi:hypothetical protein